MGIEIFSISNFAVWQSNKRRSFRKNRGQKTTLAQMKKKNGIYNNNMIANRSNDWRSWKRRRLFRAELSKLFSKNIRIQFKNNNLFRGFWGFFTWKKKKKLFKTCNFGSDSYVPVNWVVLNRLSGKSSVQII